MVNTMYVYKNKVGCCCFFSPTFATTSKVLWQNYLPRLLLYLIRNTKIQQQRKKQKLLALLCSCCQTVLYKIAHTYAHMLCTLFSDGIFRLKTESEKKKEKRKSVPKTRE